MISPYYVNPTNNSSLNQSFNENVQDSQVALSTLQSTGNPYLAAGAYVGSNVFRQFDKASRERQLASDLNNMTPASVSRDAFGNPIYNESNSMSSLQSINTNQIGRANINALDVLNGTRLSSKLGGSIFGGKKRRKKAAEAKRKAIERLTTAQNEFNDQNMQFQSRQLSQLDSNRVLNQRRNRLYNIPTQLY